jgi:prepilin peptidase CpaA
VGWAGISLNSGRFRFGSAIAPSWVILAIPRDREEKKEFMRALIYWPTVIVLVIATFTDVRNRRIPNWLVFPFFGSGVAVSGWLHGWHGVGMSFAGAGLGLLIYGLLFCMGGMGAGDVKLCAAIGAWIGPTQLMFSLVFTGLVGGAMALIWALSAGFLKELFLHTGDLAFGSKERGEVVLNNPLRRKMPYAPAIAVGTLISFIAR